ncbi:probable disease resistance protein At5g63020 [Hibiscus syriacus]|uniref:probable disease resistance protein At5g63020 n=1 Tax=Hibiscus syriacus TaxID=106335 RepID=UPI00192351E7|nr:probable disease resistance protein At5g63020 [Hibiscus syriacus]
MLKVNVEVQDLDDRIGESSALTRGFHTEVSKSIKEVEELITQQERGKFDTVIWITVSNETSIATAEDVASKIGVEFSGDEETTRAGMLFENLSQKGRFVMILDDLWAKVSLERIGIPELSNGGWNQLQDQLLSVVQVALGNNYSSFFCALYPEDWEIEEEDLIQLWIREGLVEEMDSMQAEYDNGRAIMNRFISNCLLEVFTEEEHARTVKMHDLLRDMALRIAESRFLVKAGMKLEKAPDVQEWSMNLEKVSLIWNQWYIPLEMSPPKCPRLTTLLLSQCNSKYSRGFFKHMDALKVLDLSFNPIKSLPSSLSKCLGLTTLLFSDCCIESIPESFFDDMNELRFLIFPPILSRSSAFLSNLKNLTSLLLADVNNYGMFHRCQILEF